MDVQTRTMAKYTMEGRNWGKLASHAFLNTPPAVGTVSVEVMTSREEVPHPPRSELPTAMAKNVTVTTTAMDLGGLA